MKSLFNCFVLILLSVLCSSCNRSHEEYDYERSPVDVSDCFNRCPHQQKQVITVRHRDFTGFVSDARLSLYRHSDQGLKQERRSTFVIKKQMETKRFRLLVAASFS